MLECLTPPVGHPAPLTALVLAGGRGTRMGGIDKGLQPFNGTPLAQHALQRLRQQRGGPIGTCAVNANRHLPAYEAFGVPVWPDVLDGHPGPLAGFLTGLQHCATPLLLTVPCDTPRFPLDLAERLADAMEREDAEIAVAAGREDDGQVRAQPVFCLLRVALRESLARFIQDGGRKTGAWIASHRAVTVPFDHEGDDPLAFANANTLAELRALERP